MSIVNYPILQRTLPNGLRIVVSPDRLAPVVTVNLWVGVGSRHEVAGRTGFAHLFEHLMFQGSENVAGGEHFAALLAEGGRLNATTWFDRTNYFETVPTGALELALWLEADRHGRLLTAVTQENLDNQRDVVKEEKRQRYDNVPYGTAMIDVCAAVFPEGHPYHHPTIGSMEDLDAATLADVHAFYRRYYGPDNTVLTVVGDVEPDEAFAAVEKHFSGLTPLDEPARGVGPELLPMAEPTRIERYGQVPTDRLYLAFRLPPDHTPPFLAAGMALDALGGLATSRLVERLVRRERVATSLSANAMGFVDGASLGLISVDIADDGTPEMVEQAICEELHRFAEEGLTSHERESILAETRRSWLSALASQEERADQLSRFALLAGDPGRINTLLDEFDAVSDELVRAVAARWLSPQCRAVVAYLRAGEERA